MAAGSAVGGCLRHGLGLLVQQGAGATAFPWGTWAANVLGCLAIGLAMPLLAKGSPTHLLVVTGLLGGFTTFSAFSGQTIELAGQGRLVLAATYVVASLAACLTATAVGAWITGR